MQISKRIYIFCPFDCHIGKDCVWLALRNNMFILRITFRRKEWIGFELFGFSLYVNIKEE